MTKQDEQWDDLMKDWQSGELDSIDTGVIQSKVNSSGQRIAFETIVNVLAGLALGGYLVYELMQGLPSMLDVALYSFVLVVALTVIFTNVWIRRNNYSALGKDSQTYLRLILTRAQSTLKLSKTSMLFCAVLFIGFEGLFLTLFGLSFISDNKMAKPELALAILVFVTLFFPLMYFLLKRFTAKVTAQVQKLEVMLAESE